MTSQMQSCTCSSPTMLCMNNSIILQSRYLLLANSYYIYLLTHAYAKRQSTVKLCIVEFNGGLKMQNLFISIEGLRNQNITSIESLCRLTLTLQCFYQCRENKI